MGRICPCPEPRRPQFVEGRRTEIVNPLQTHICRRVADQARQVLGASGLLQGAPMGGSVLRKVSPGARQQCVRTALTVAAGEPVAIGDAVIELDVESVLRAL